MTLVGATAKNFQRRIYAEVEKKGADHLLLKQIAPPGHRYRLIRKRDPFKPLIIDGVLQVARAKPKAKKRVKARSRPKSKGKGEVKDFRGYGREFKKSPKIPLEVYKRLKKDDPDLYADLDHYATLFQNKSKLKSMSRAEYRGAVSKYKAILTRASEKKLYPTPLQVGYKSIKLMGVIWKNQEMVALVELKGSMGQTVKKGVLIGPNYGVVESIKRDEIIIVERSRDYLGNILTSKKSIEFFNKPDEG
jgi:Tfp pilus assembly protein PilP